MQYETRDNVFPTIPVGIVGIGQLQGLTDTGAERSAFRNRNVPEDDVRPRDKNSFSSLRGVTYPTGAISVQLKTAAGKKNLQNMAALDDLSANLVLGAHFPHQQ